MTAQTPTILKTYFETGDIPSQAQFGSLIDSYVNVAVSAAQTIQSDVSALGSLDLPNGGQTIGLPTGGNKGPGTINVASNVFINGTAIGTPSGSGTVVAGTANQIAYYPSSTNTVSGTNALPNGTTATTQSAADSSTKVATTNFVNGTALTLASGTTAITQSNGDNSTKVATTAYVTSAISTVQVPTPLGIGSIILALNNGAGTLVAGGTTLAANLVAESFTSGPVFNATGDVLAGTWQTLQHTATGQTSLWQRTT